MKTFKRSSDFVSIYTNNTLWGYSKFDFQMVCARAEISRDDEHQVTLETAIILTSPEHAKLILNDLTKMVRNYENDYGEIIIHKDKVVELPTKEEEILASAVRRKKK
ncbi:hypothetical protein BH10ACI1_BH10ACI1_29440 [soil metagenome]